LHPFKGKIFDDNKDDPFNLTEAKLGWNCTQFAAVKTFVFEN